MGITTSERSDASATASRPSPAASDQEPVPAVAKAAFWVTVAIVALALFSIGAVAAWGSYAAAYFLMFLLVFGSLFVAVLGAVGFVQSVRAGSDKGALMSALPWMIVLLLIVVRIVVTF